MLRRGFLAVLFLGSAAGAKGIALAADIIWPSGAGAAKEVGRGRMQASKLAAGSITAGSIVLSPTDVDNLSVRGAVQAGIAAGRTGG